VRHEGVDLGRGVLTVEALTDHHAALVVEPRKRGLHRATLRPRVVFDRDGEPGPFAPWHGVPTRHVPLTAHNALTALQASAVIPSVLEGFGAEIDAADGFTLLPCLGPKLAPGWLDRVLPSQHTPSLRRTIMIAPSAAHLASLPGGKVPDRSDFATMSDRERITAWRHVISLGEAMGYQLMELLESDRIRHVAQPLA